MTRTLFIAPQWIGDAVMTEPLLRELHRRGEQITVAALSWVAPVYEHMASVSEVVTLPFKHGQLQCLNAGLWRGNGEVNLTRPMSPPILSKAH